jgi:hypothetical protein
MPSTMLHKVSASLFQENIYITAYQTRSVFRYSIMGNAYVKLEHKLGKEAEHILFTRGSKLYCIESVREFPSSYLSVQCLSDDCDLTGID